MLKLNLKKIFKKLYLLILAHFQLLFVNNLDPVKDIKPFDFKTTNHNFSNNILKQKTSGTSNHSIFALINKNYFLPILLILYVVFDSIYCLNQASFKYSTTDIPSMFIHQIMPKAIWPVSDTMVSLAIFFALLNYTCLLLYPMLSQKLLMYNFINDDKNKTPKIIQNGKTLTFEISISIFSFRKKAKWILKCSYLIVYTIVQLFVHFNFYKKLTTKNTNMNIQNTVLWIDTFFIVFYIVLGKLKIIVF